MYSDNLLNEYLTSQIWWKILHLFCKFFVFHSVELDIFTTQLNLGLQKDILAHAQNEKENYKNSKQSNCLLQNLNLLYTVKPLRWTPFVRGHSTLSHLGELFTIGYHRFTLVCFCLKPITRYKQFIRVWFTPKWTSESQCSFLHRRLCKRPHLETEVN